ncbi:MULTISPECIES: amino acid ABC transporter ATP-binding protein [Limibacillus]|jgi:polar amino acid transport system ATP-binding protein|uniref:Polar amino acid transport system ATP-binding protein n=1 Tax=Limibacillus halophilus TaxID=1579333 RepID=A0A839SSQ7_9PROT|nr:amino acid ABC transporter ATP-binding protein [Limibacillus halophilus]MBB3065358.1 polar amino acid transport system ATP-binding protein [Limibacillus halophilus]
MTAELQGGAGPKELIRVRGLHKSFGSLKVLQDIDMTVETGKTVVLIGPSGSGKSTLLRCMNLLETIEQGSITFDGQEIANLTQQAHRIRRDIAMVFQNFELFKHLSAAENIMLAPMKVKGVPRLEAHDRALELLEKVKIPDKADTYPEQLSGGQQQRVAIARALAMDPKAILYDEPTSALDPEMIREVLDVMLELSNAGMTSVVVTHEMSFARRAADHMVFMDKGLIVESCATDQFFDGEVSARTKQFLDQILH